MDVVISATTHCSGSTMLQRIFTAREKTLIWVENGGCLIDFCKMYRNSTYYAHFGKQRKSYFDNEVRYGHKELDLLRVCYSDCTVFLLVRNSVNAWKSLSTKGRKVLYDSLKQFTERWNRPVEDYLEMSSSDLDIHLVKYEDIVAQKTETIHLIKQTGNLKDKVVKRVLAKKINSSNKPLFKHTKQTIYSHCRHLMKKVGFFEKRDHSNDPK